MTRALSALAGLLVLSACGDPLAEFDEYADLKISAETRPVAALPETVPEDGPIGPLAELNNAEASVDPTVSAAVDTALASLDARAERKAAQGGGGLFGWLRRQADAADDAKLKEAQAETAQYASAQAPAIEDAAPAEVTTEAQPVNAVQVAEPAQEPAPDARPATPVAEAPAEPEQPVEVASLAPEALIDAAEEPRAEPKPEPKPKRRGLFSAERKAQRPKANAAAQDVTFGTLLPFGEVGRVCEARSKPLGQRVERSETRGQTYTLYDSAPESAAPRTYYVTGFADKCPRQFTAVMAMFGKPSLHEGLRYGKPATQYPYSDTDRAYEKIKSRICGVGPRKPCGSKIETLERDTVFISTYENFSGTGRWADVLIHDSTVVATAVKRAGDPIQ